MVFTTIRRARTVRINLSKLMKYVVFYLLNFGQYMYFFHVVFVIFESFQAIRDLNIYDILEPCYHAPGSIIQLKNTNVPLSFRRLGETERPLPIRKRIFGRAWPYRAPVKDGYVPSWPQLLNSVNVPCTVRFSFFVTVYLFKQQFAPKISRQFS